MIGDGNRVPAQAGLGTLSRVDARTVWRDEARDFTPWLAVHLELLGQELGLELELESREVGIGSFSADIIAATPSGQVVVIENQLERTDHSHLGQIMTYAAGKDASIVVWIAPEFRPEHREALDWLNSNTGEGLSFFGGEVELLKINDSPPAPHFRLVSQPNEWAKATKAADPQSAPSELGLRYQAFFSEILARFNAVRPHLTSGSRVGTGNWYPFSAGRTGFQFVWSVSAGPRFRVELYIDAGSADENAAYLQALREYDVQLEEAVGAPFSWELLPTKRACRIAVYHDIDRAKFDKDEQLLDWAVTTMVKFVDALRPLIQVLHT
jgi:hypothetical protein